MYPQRITPSHHAFTLLELLVVITIVAILAGLLLPVFSRIQMRSYETQTLSNMRAMGVAFLAYAGDNQYQLPGRSPLNSDGTPGPKWPTVLQPYVGNLAIYGSPIPDVNGKKYKVANPPTPYPQLYLSNTTNYTSYIYNGGNDAAVTAGVAYSAPVSFPRLNVIGLPSQTILLGVPLPQAANYYMDFTEGNNSQILNKAAFVDGTPYVFADGSARTLTVLATANNVAAPVSSGTYTDWLWLFDKSQTGIIH